MSLMLVTAPTSDPVTLAEARAHLRVTDAGEDALIVGYLLAAREYVETYTRRALMAQEWDQFDDELGTEIVLRKRPVLSVTSVKYLDTSGVEQTLAADQYRLVRRQTGDAVVIPAYGVTWPSVRAAEAAVTVRFSAGYGSSPSSVPEAIRQAILLLVGHWFAHRESVNAGNIVSEVPMGVEALLFPHRAFY